MRVPAKALFGEGFYQDAEVIRINKSDLPLTASTNNTAQSLLVALLVKAMGVFSGVLQDSNGNVLTNENDEPLEFDNSALYERLNVSLWSAYPQVKRGNSVITHTCLMDVYASPSIDYYTPITPNDL